MPIKSKIAWKHETTEEDMGCQWWNIRDGDGRSVVREFSFDVHSDPFPPAVEYAEHKNIYGRKPGYYAVQRGVDAMDGAYPLGPYKNIDTAKVAALGGTVE